MNRAWLVVALLLSLGVNLGLVGTAVARRHQLERRFGLGDEAPRSPDRPGERFADRLGLARESRDRFVAVHRRMAEASFRARSDVARIRRELRREVMSAAPDRKQIEELLAELSRQESVANRALVDGVLEARSGLSARELRDYLLALERFGPRSESAPPKSWGHSPQYDEGHSRPGTEPGPPRRRLERDRP